VYSKKGQSAMEYLMTYGWAILIILIAIGALFYLGVFSPSTPSTCTASAPITCTDVKAIADTGGTVTLVLGTTGTSSATLSSITTTSPIAGTCSPATAISSVTPTPISCTVGAMTVDSKLTGTGTVTYSLEGSTVVHTTTVQFSGTVEAS